MLVVNENEERERKSMLTEGVVVFLVCKRRRGEKYTVIQLETRMSDLNMGGKEKFVRRECFFS